MKVVHLMRDNAGAVFAFDEVTYLSDVVSRITTLIPGHMPGDMKARYTRAGLEIIDTDPNLYPNSISRTARNAVRLREVLSKLDPDIVHVHHILPCMLLRLASGRHPFFKRIFEVHGPLHLEIPHTRWADLWTRGQSDYYIATSKATYRRYLGCGVPESRMTMIYSGSNTNNYIRSSKGKLRSALGVSGDVPLVGMVAWMYPPNRIMGQFKGLKGHDLFIKAIPLIRQQFPDARFVIIGGELSGTDKYAAKLRAMAKGLHLDDVLTFLGARDDVAEIQPDLNVAVHPSRSENPGGAVYTLLAGVPTAGSSVGGIPEIVRHGETGLLFPTDNVKELAEAVMDLLSDPLRAKEMALRGRELAKDLFDIQNTAPRVLDFYQRIQDSSDAQPRPRRSG